MFLIPHYGYYKDYFKLLETVSQDHDYTRLIDKIYEIVINQIKLDAGEYENALLEGRKPIISLLAKYIPKENKHFDKKYSFVDKISNMMYPGVDVEERKKIYRIQVSILNKALDTVEIKMSARKFSEIVYAKITSNNALKYRKAFLNMNLNDKLQRSMEEDRVKGKDKFIKSIIENSVKGGALEINDLIRNIADYIYRTSGLDTLDPLIEQDCESVLFAKLWDSMRESLLQRINNNIKKTFTLDNLIPIVDVSGSMAGYPIRVGTGLGILVSEIGSIRDRMITFSESPEWINLENLNIVEKVSKVMQSQWYLNTNFEKVYRMIIDIVRTKKLKQHEIPNIIVFSDMQFDQASGQDQWDTHYEIIMKEFQKVGEELEGVGYEPPMIIFWNLRGDAQGFPVMKNTSNVKMLSGFSPNLLQYVLDGNVTENMVETDEKAKTNETPYSALRQMLDDDRYEIIREIVKASIKN